MKIFCLPLPRDIICNCYYDKCGVIHCFVSCWSVAVTLHWYCQAPWKLKSYSKLLLQLSSDRYIWIWVFHLVHEIQRSTTWDSAWWTKNTRPWYCGRSIIFFEGGRHWSLDVRQWSESGVWAVGVYPIPSRLPSVEKVVILPSSVWSAMPASNDSWTFCTLCKLNFRTFWRQWHVGTEHLILSDGQLTKKF